MQILSMRRTFTIRTKTYGRSANTTARIPSMCNSLFCSTLFCCRAWENCLHICLHVYACIAFASARVRAYTRRQVRDSLRAYTSAVCAKSIELIFSQPLLLTPPPPFSFLGRLSTVFCTNCPWTVTSTALYLAKQSHFRRMELSWSSRVQNSVEEVRVCVCVCVCGPLVRKSERRESRRSSERERKTYLRVITTVCRHQFCILCLYMCDKTSRMHCGGNHRRPRWGHSVGVCRLLRPPVSGQ